MGSLRSSSYSAAAVIGSSGSLYQLPPQQLAFPASPSRLFPSERRVGRGRCAGICCAPSSTMHRRTLETTKISIRLCTSCLRGQRFCARFLPLHCLTQTHRHRHIPASSFFRSGKALARQASACTSKSSFLYCPAGSQRCALGPPRRPLAFLALPDGTSLDGWRGCILRVAIYFLSESPSQASGALYRPTSRTAFAPTIVSTRSGVWTCG